jgi:hypothetical protein
MAYALPGLPTRMVTESNRCSAGWTHADRISAADFPWTLARARIRRTLLNEEYVDHHRPALTEAVGV